MNKVANKKTKQKTTRKRILLASLCGLLLVCGLFACITIVHHVQTGRQFNQDKIRFAQTEKDMADAYGAIVEKAGQPYDMKFTKGCSYGALKYARGPLGCTISYSFVYGVSTLGGGAQLAVSTQQTVKASKDTKDYRAPELVSPPDLKDVARYMHYTYGTLPGIECELNYELYDSNTYNAFPSTRKVIRSAYAADYEFDCQGGAAKPVYALSKSPE